MPALQFGLSSYQRAEGDLPELPVVNMYAEAAPSEGKVVLQSRPGMEVAQTVGNGPVRAVFEGDLVLAGSLFVVSGWNLYRDGVLLGAIDGDGPVSICGYENFVFVAGGRRLWGYDGTTLAAISFPDGASVAKVLIGGSRLVAIREDTGQFYWSEVLGTTIDGLDFATAES